MEPPPAFLPSPACGGGRVGASGRAARQGPDAPRDPPPTPPASEGDDGAGRASNLLLPRSQGDAGASTSPPPLAGEAGWGTAAVQPGKACRVEGPSPGPSRKRYRMHTSGTRSVLVCGFALWGRFRFLAFDGVWGLARGVARWSGPRAFFGDRRVDRSYGFLHDRLVRQGPRGLSVRRPGGSRAGAVRIGRFLRHDKVTVEKIVDRAAAGTASRVAGLDVLAIQDTTSFRDDGLGNSLVGQCHDCG